MAIVKLTLESGSEIELEVSGEQADGLVSGFARFVSKNEVPDKRTIFSPIQSLYVDYSKVAMVRRDF